ncbi:DUF2306 domain-containing protein [Roseivirga echinicomitans]|uniref:DUF2306 domain-containing protein n=1 Tax=Roseivirga echinicomitans TaxID=296218 RepID=A0A150XUK4_9BACT|nr:DUF2306 domain-containing protein [Roseivirga echinicomitans]KYG82438.1 hypothetical protein AWN68_14355 [Roseivirga echinicomitans]
MEFLESLKVFSSYLGLLHTCCAVLAMVFGAMVVFNTKGTGLHRKIGYAYVGSMVFMNLSGFGIYNFGSFSLFHAFALISLITVLLGVIPAIRRSKDWYKKHFYFMSWSVVGLYCAFWSEVGVRFFDMQYFWWVVMLATMLTGLIGMLVIKKKAKSLFVN